MLVGIAVVQKRCRRALRRQHHTIKRNNPLMNASPIVATLPLADAFSLTASTNGRDDIAHELRDLMKRLDE